MPAKMTHEQFAEIVRDRGQNQYRLLDLYQTTHHKIRFEHIECGYIFEMRPSRFVCGDRCPKCGNAVRKTHSEYVAELEKHFPGEYLVLGKYVNTMTPILTRHQCGYEWEISPNTMLRRVRKPHAGCPQCNKKHRRTHDDFVREIAVLVGTEYSVLGKYRNFREKVEFRHETCGQTFDMSSGLFLGGCRCPYCALRNKTSKAVQAIENWLTSHGRSYEREVALEGCVFQRQLKFDFLVDESLLIEYDGRQHFIVGPNWKVDMLVMQERDAFKTNFCQERGYPLLRIPYVSDVVQVLEDVLVRGMDPWSVTEREFGRLELDGE
jgi:hypothetical protein